MEELLKRLTIEYNETANKCIELLKQMYELKVRVYLEGAAARRAERIKALEDAYNAKVQELRRSEIAAAEKAAKAAEENRIKKLMQADAKIAEILAAEEAAWKAEQEEAVREAAKKAAELEAEMEEVRKVAEEQEQENNE